MEDFGEGLWAAVADALHDVLVALKENDADLARAVGPGLRVIFPGVPRDHPAMSAMILNIAANIMGLANAATPSLSMVFAQVGLPIEGIGLEWGRESMTPF